MVCNGKIEGTYSSEKMNALIIGGSGGLSSVVAQIAMKHYNVWTLTRGVHELPEGVRALRADRNDLSGLKQVLAGADVKWDVVFDCICMNREHAEADLEILPEYTDRLIVVSTDSVYDGRYKRIPEREDGICINEIGETEKCSYAGNKRHMEEVFLADMESSRSGLKITIFRPGHIYGPGFLLGCFPEHSRQRELPELILKGEEIRLVGMGTYVIHPVYVEDLARAMVDCVNKEKTYGEIFCIGGPEAVENKTYYETIAECLGTDVKIKEIPLEGYLDKHPEYAGHLCHRVYDLTKLREAGVRMPSVGIYEGIERTLRSMGYQTKRYCFYGWEKADIRDKNGLTPRDYYDILSGIWCAKTCAPRMRAEWQDENKTYGQCSITAFLMQDIFGGKVRGILRSGGNYHCFNDVNGCVFDLTSEQFGDEILDYSDCPEQAREVHFAKEEKRLRYEYLRAKCLAYVENRENRER